jgi:hypothetical protein
MRLEVLDRLAASMRAQQIDVQLFEHRHGRGRFDVFFFVGQPSEMLVGARSADPPLAFSVEVHPEGKFNPFLGDQYGLLCEFLGLRPNPENPFSPTAFFQQMELSIPLVAQHARVPPRAAIAQYGRMEDSDKLHFVGWRDNTSRGTSVSKENLEKTRRLLGWSAFDLCRRGNVSSCWTDDAARAVTIDLAALQGRPRR